ncbi:hypothetical protein JB92DRAFT_2578833, partial [Gautieria morchelliformis]
NGERGEFVRVRAVIDGGAMRNMIDSTKWREWGMRLKLLQPSNITLRVADNHGIRSEGSWKGPVSVAGITVEEQFKVFDSGGAFEVILGKP